MMYMPRIVARVHGVHDLDDGEPGFADRASRPHSASNFAARRALSTRL